MRSRICGFLIVGLVAVLPGRPTAQTVSVWSDLSKDWNASGETMMRIADAMPEDKFSFRATPPERTYGEQILHVAGANVMLLKFLGAKAPAPAVVDSDLSTFGLKATTKAEILKALGDSYVYGEAVLREFNDASLAQTIRGPRWIGEATRAKMVWYTMSHTQDIYGQMVVYLRLNGIVPPASRRGGV